MIGELVLGRPPLEFDLAEARGFVRERSVLVTGGGGSIGSELCCELAELGCARIAVLDHFDHGLLAACERVREQFPKVQVIEVLCDIRDLDRLQRWFGRVRPDVVINAAALKHVHLGERHPIECIRTNLLAVRNVLEASASAGAHSFVQVSTDKAAAPVCVMGAAKRLAELYLHGYAQEHADAPAVKIVRFGNVLGSQGSVVPRFRRRIEAQRNLEVTHPDMRRFFMTAQEASRFVLQVCAHEAPRSRTVTSFCMDLGESVRIVDIARQMIAAANAPVDIVYSAPREGEKLGEVLYDEYEIAVAGNLEHCYRIALKSPSAALSSRALSALEAYAQSHDGVQVAQRLFAMLDECLGRREAAAG